VQTATTQPFLQLHFQILPAFARHLLEHYLEAYTQFQLDLSRKSNIPLLKSFAGLPDAELLKISNDINRKLFTYLAQNEAQQHIDENLKRWKENTLPQIDQHAIAAEDITYFTYIRKQAFLHFVPTYSTDIAIILALIEEIDRFLLEMETASTNLYVSLLRDEINKNVHMLEKVTNTLPGAVYVFDVIDFKGVYANQNLSAVIGYTQNELNALGENAIARLIHPDDIAATEIQLAKIRSAADGEINTYIYRVLAKDGQYHWIRNYEAVFKRREDGMVTQTIGIMLNIDKEQQLTNALAEREAQYKKAETLANLGHYSYDFATKKIEWTDQLYAIYGLEPQSEPITLSRFLSFIHPDDREAVIQKKDALFEAKKVNYSFRIITDTGKEKTVRSIAQLQLNEAGKPIKVIGTEQDITEKQNLIDRLQQSEQLYKQAQALAHIGNWVWNVDTNAIQWSDEVYRIFEIPPDEPLVVDVLLDFIHPDERESSAALIQQSIANKTPYDQYQRIVLRNGQTKIIHRRAEVRTAADGKSLLFIGTTQDVTQQKAIEQELRNNQDFIKKIADASPTILYLFDVSQNSFSYINQEIYYVLGYSMDEIIEMKADVTHRIYHPDDIELLPERKESNKKFEHSDSMLQYECRLKGKEGQWCWLLVREVIFKTDEAGNTLQILGAALDISKRKEMERTLMQNTLLLEQSNASLEEFAYVASHDLKEPLRKIATFGDRLVNTHMESLTPDGKMYLKKIIDASQRMQIMINDLLSVSMISGNRSFEPYSLQAILDEVLQTLEYKIEQKNAVIKSDTLPEARIVPSQFRQLFQNLISNSLKFVNETVQPHVTIKHSYVDPQEVTLLNSAARYLKLEFIDNGIGFEEEYAGKIFTIFQRLHGRSEYEGTGIGLAICKKIVEHHSGVIYATATPGKGATFTILLPA